MNLLTTKLEYRKFYVLAIVFTCALNSFAQPGKNGPFIVNTPNTIVNCYTAVITSVSSGSNSINTDNACTFECGDLIMIYQAQGATINTTNSSAYGQISNINSAGLYEFNYVVSNAGGVLTLQNPLSNSYSSIGNTQIVKVPQYTNLTVNAGASIVPIPWQSTGAFKKGGLVVIHSTGTITVNGTIHSNTMGFKAGALEQNASAAGIPEITDYVTNNSSASAEKGEGIAGDAISYDALGGRYGKGAPANGGGGGNSHNCGGGGGSNGNNLQTYNGQGIMCTACPGSAAWALDPFVIATGSLSNSSGGGRGGYSYGASNQNALVIGPNSVPWGGNRRNSNGGFGGYPLSNVANTRIFFGGGGGAGDTNNNGNQRGGNGGGIVYLVASNVTGVGAIQANGENALNQVALGTAGANDAPCGGGGGGSIVIKSPTSAGLQLQAIGGKGGDQGALPVESEGPGGGGGGGFIAINSGTPLISVAGGANGITLSGSLTEFNTNGATSGAYGNTETVPLSFITFVPITISALVNSPICQGGSLNFNTTVSIPGGTYDWSGPNGFNSTLSNPTISAAQPIHSGVYQVIYTSPGGCKDTFQVTAIVNPLPVAIINPTPVTCFGSCNGIASSTITTSSLAPYSYTWSNGGTTPSISGLCAGVYNLLVTDANLCTTTVSTNISTPTALSMTSVATNVTCNGSCNGSVTLNASGGTAPYSYKKNAGPSQVSPVFSALCAGTYVFTVTDANGCVFNLSVTITQPPVLTSTIASITNATCGLNNGSISLNTTGGTPAYSYTLGGTTNSTGVFSNLSPGNYTINVVDLNNCSTTVNFTINALTVPVVTIQSQQNITCAGGNNGAVLLMATGGQAPYQFAIGSSAFGFSNLFSNLIAGVYSFTVKDANNCTAIVNTTITAPSPVSFTSIVSNVLCFGQCNGQISINASGGVAPYSYSSNSGNTFQSSSLITGLCAGTYEVVVRDFNGCLINAFNTVNEPPILALTTTTANPTCNGVANGTIQVNASGGVGAYTYSLNNGPFGSSSFFNSVAGGSNLIEILDANACPAQLTVNIVEPDPILITQVDMIPSNCGFNNGSFEVLATGNFPSFSYSDNNGPFQASGLFTNVFSGIHVIVVQDANGCTDTLFAGVNDLEMSGVEISRTEPLCFGGNDGTILVQNVSGAFPITYELDGNGLLQNNGFFSGLNSGSHIVVIFDAGNCIFTIPFILNEPPPITFSDSIINATCNLGSNGEIHFTNVSGGTPGAYTFSIDGGVTYTSNTAFTGLTQGVYDLYVQDINNCLANQPSSITEPTPIAITSNKTDLLCFNDQSGIVIVNATGSNGNFSYVLNSVNSSSGFYSNLNAGNYTAIAIDQLGCSDTISLIVNEPDDLIITGTFTNPLCSSSCDATMTVSGNGGTGSYLYTQDNIVFNANGLFLNECPGVKTIYIKDQNLCLDSIDFNIISPNPITMSAVTSPSTCSQANGSITLLASGGTGSIQYSINNGNSFSNSGAFTLLNADTYSVVAQDSNNCFVDSVLTIIDLPSPVISGVSSINPSCFQLCDGQVDVTSTGGTGSITFSLNGVNQSSGSFTNICAGNYTVSVTDVNGCTNSQPINISEPTLLTAISTPTNLSCFENNSGEISILANGGTTPYLYSFDNGLSFGNNPIASFLTAGNYNLVVKDQMNCLSNLNITLTEPLALSASITSIQPTCTGHCDGQATAVENGGTPGGFTYFWDGNAGLSSVNTLCAGNHDFELIDINGCVYDTVFVVTDPALFVIDSVEWTNISCNSLCDGTVSIFADDAVSFSFNGFAFQANSTQNGFCSGAVQIQALNSFGCIANGIALITQPDPLQLFTTPDSLMCMNDTIPLFALAFGGTSPYTYTWSNGFVGSTQEVIQSSPQTYTVNVIDDNGCTTTAGSINLTILPLLQLDLQNVLHFCPNDPVNLSVNVLNGAPTYSYIWNNNQNDSLNTLTVYPVQDSIVYTVQVSDICSSIDTSILVQQYAIPNALFEIDNQNGCTPLTVNFSTDNALNFTNCVWTFSDGQQFNSCGTITAVFDQVGCWDATLEASSNDGCPVEYTFNNAICVNGLPNADFFYNPTVPTEIENTVSFFNTSSEDSIQFWDIGNFSTEIENPVYQFTNVNEDSEIEVCLTVVSTSGCMDTICKIIQFGSDFLFWVPNSFTPDGDEYNAYFGPVFSTNDLIENYRFEIYNRWGERIFESENQNEKWNGNYSNDLVQDGTYVWVLYFKNKQKQKVERIEGHVNVLK